MKLPMGEHMIVVNGVGVASELLDRRSVIYCDRVYNSFDILFKTSALTDTYY